MSVTGESARGRGAENPGRGLLSLEEISLLFQGHPSRQIWAPLEVEVGGSKLQAQVEATGCRRKTGTQVSAQPKEESPCLFSEVL